MTDYSVRRTVNTPDLGFFERIWLLMWTSLVIIGSNVIVFTLAPLLSEQLEAHSDVGVRDVSIMRQLLLFHPLLQNQQPPRLLRLLLL